MPCFVFYAIKNQICLRLEKGGMIFPSTLIWNHKHIQDTQEPTDWHIYKYISTPPVTFTEQLPVLLVEINHL